jgi:hypothetical protein
MFYFGHVCFVFRVFLYLTRHLFRETWEIFCYYFVEYIMYIFGLYSFSLNAHDSQAFTFNGIVEYLYIPFAALECWAKGSSVFFH